MNGKYTYVEHHISRIGLTESEIFTLDLSFLSPVTIRLEKFRVNSDAELRQFWGFEGLREANQIAHSVEPFPVEGFTKSPLMRCARTEPRLSRIPPK
jgi:hypothetical protein